MAHPIASKAARTEGILKRGVSRGAGGHPKPPVRGRDAGHKGKSGHRGKK